MAGGHEIMEHGRHVVAGQGELPHQLFDDWRLRIGEEAFEDEESNARERLLVTHGRSSVASAGA